MILNAITGKEEFPIGQCKLNLFFAPSSRFPGSETFLGMAAREGKNGISAHGQRTVIPAVQGGVKELGEWTNASYNVPERMVLKIFGQKKTQEVSRPTMASMFVQVRDSAPLNRVLFRTLGWSRAAFQSVMIEGRFDIISADEARALGVYIPAQYAHYAQEDYIRRLFTVEQVAPETHTRVEVAPRVVENSLGQEVEIVTTRRRRGISL